jgi:hypothetical protein
MHRLKKGDRRKVPDTQIFSGFLHQGFYFQMCPSRNYKCLARTVTFLRFQFYGFSSQYLFILVTQLVADD